MKRWWESSSGFTYNVSNNKWCFFVSKYINVGVVGYGLKMPSDFSLGTNCVFNVSNPGITENNYSYVINSNVPTLNSGGLTEIAIPTLTGVTVSTFVGCLSPAPNVMNNNVMNNNVTNNNKLNNEDSLSGLNTNKKKIIQDKEKLIFYKL